MKRFMNGIGCGALIAMALALLTSPFTFAWYQAGLQQRIYQRQGIDMTRWEIFMGAQPAERVIQIREDSRK